MGPCKPGPPRAQCPPTALCFPPHAGFVRSFAARFAGQGRGALHQPPTCKHKYVAPSGHVPHPPRCHDVHTVICNLYRGPRRQSRGTWRPAKSQSSTRTRTRDWDSPRPTGRSSATVIDRHRGRARSVRVRGDGLHVYSIVLYVSTCWPHNSQPAGLLLAPRPPSCLQYKRPVSTRYALILPRIFAWAGHALIAGPDALGRFWVPRHGT